MSNARVGVEIVASTSRFADALRKTERDSKRWQEAMARNTKPKKGFGDVAKNAAGHFGGEMMSRGLDAITGAVDNVRDFERSLTRFGITANANNSTIDAWRSQIRGISKDTGIADQQILSGAQTYIDLTGDVEGATRAMGSFARIAQASGSSTEDIATATSAMKEAMQLDAGDVEAVFSGLIVQGKAGAVSLKDFAGELSVLGPQFAAFGTKGPQGIREMGAAFQIIRKGAGSAGEASTQFQAVMGEIVSSHKALKAIGVDVWQKNPQTGVRELKPFAKIMEDMANNKKLDDPARMAKIFGRKEAQAAVRTLRANVEGFKDLTKAAEDTGAVERDLNTFRASSAGRLDLAMNKLKVTIAETFTPERIQGFVGAVESLAEKLGPVAEVVGKVGDAFGSLYGAGQSIRGFFDDANPFDASSPFAMMKLARQGGEGAILAEQRKHAAFARSRDSIMGAEKDEKSTPESIRRAVIASYKAAGPNATEEDRASALAGSMYLDAAGVKPQQGREIYAREMLDKLPKEIANAIRIGLDGVKLNTELGKDKVVEATRTSKSNHTRP